MTLNELIAQLQTMVEQNEILGEAEVLIAHQPSYPLAVQIDVLTADYTDGDADPVIWIAAGDHPGSKRSPASKRTIPARPRAVVAALRPSSWDATA